MWALGSLPDRRQLPVSHQQADGFLGETVLLAFLVPVSMATKTALHIPNHPGWQTGGRLGPCQACSSICLCMAFRTMKAGPELLVWLTVGPV